MAKLKIETSQGVCEIEALASKIENPVCENLTWRMSGIAMGGGVQIEMNAYYPTRQQARDATKSFIAGVSESLTEDGEND